MPVAPTETVAEAGGARLKPGLRPGLCV